MPSIQWYGMNPNDYIKAMSSPPKPGDFGPFVLNRFFMEEDQVYPAGWSAFYCRGYLFDGPDQRENLLNALAWSVVYDILEEERARA